MTTTTLDESPAILRVLYTVEDGISFTTTVSVDGSAVNWTGATFEATARSGTSTGTGGTAVASTGAATITVSGNASGVISFTIDDAVTTTMGAGRFPFSIRATFPGNDPLTYVAGVLEGTYRAVHA